MKKSNNEPKPDPENPAPRRCASGSQQGGLDPKPSEGMEQVQEAPEITTSELVATMSSALSARQRKTPWLDDALRSEMIRRFGDALIASTDTPLRDFVRWVIDDGRYLAVEGNFKLFCRTYLATELDRAGEIWAWAVKRET